jgi:hypothetical protein
MCFLRRGVVSTSPNPQAGGPLLVGYPRLLNQFIHSYPPYRRPFLYPQPEDAPCRGDRDPYPWTKIVIDNKIIEQVNSFIYLGNMTSYKKELDIDNKLHNYLKITGTLNNVLGHKKLLRKQE